MSNSMAIFSEALTGWQTPMFADCLISDIEQLDADQLQLQKALTHGNYADADDLSVILLSTKSDREEIHVKVGVFYVSIIAGCECSGDPTPSSKRNEYCELNIDISKITAEAQIVLSV